VRLFGLEDTRTHAPPMEDGFEINGAILLRSPRKTEMTTMYRSLIGSIRYAVVTVRFDVSYDLNGISRYLSRPNARLIDAAKRIVEYLVTVHTKDLGIKWTMSE